MPERERLALCQRAYDAGNFAQVRKLASDLVASEDRELAAAAAQLVSRVAVDPVALGVLACSLLFFVLIAKIYVF